MSEKPDEWEKLGNRLRDARQYRGYSQQEIADFLDISRSSVSLIENGDRKINSIELRNLANFYNTSIDNLIGESLEGIGDHDEIEMVARTTKDLTPEDREEVLRFAEFLRSKSSGEEDG